MAIAGLGTGVSQAPGKPLPGAAYAGAIEETFVAQPVRFKVSSNGRRVTDIRIPGPPQCYLGRAYVPAVNSGTRSFAINKRKESFSATFKSEVAAAAPAQASHFKIVLTGRFLPGGGEEGTISTTQSPYTANQEFASECNSAGFVEGTYETKVPGKPSLPSPCQLAGSELADLTGDPSTTSASGELRRSSPGTYHATATCSFWAGSSFVASLYLGYLPAIESALAPGEPVQAVTSAAIPGFPGARLLTSEDPVAEQPGFFMIVSFTFKVAKKTLYGVIAASFDSGFESCPLSGLAGDVETAARVLREISGGGVLSLEPPGCA